MLVYQSAISQLEVLHWFVAYWNHASKVKRGHYCVMYMQCIQWLNTIFSVTNIEISCALVRYSRDVALIVYILYTCMQYCTTYCMSSYLAIAEHVMKWMMQTSTEWHAHTVKFTKCSLLDVMEWYRNSDAYNTCKNGHNVCQCMSFYTSMCQCLHRWTHTSWSLTQSCNTNFRKLLTLYIPFSIM